MKFVRDENDHLYKNANQ